MADQHREQPGWEPTHSQTANAAGVVTALSAAYADAFALRAAVQAIPLLGGPLDTMASGLGEKWQRERLEDFVQALTARLEALEDKGFEGPKPSEELFDFVLSMFERAKRVRSQVRRQYLANILARQVTTPIDWDLATLFADIVAGLSDLHFQVLLVTAAIPKVGGESALKNLHAVYLPVAEDANHDVVVPRLDELLLDFTLADLLFVCADLVGKGLLRDEGVDRMGYRSLELIVCAPAGHRLLEWISESIYTTV